LFGEKSKFWRKIVFFQQIIAAVKTRNILKIFDNEELKNLKKCHLEALFTNNYDFRKKIFQPNNLSEF